MAKSCVSYGFTENGPKVSVLMPVYKTNPKFLKEAIQSVLDQTFSDFEFLILDDCPLDDRESVVKSFKDPRIKYKKNDTNLGISPSRNKLIRLAKGEYLAIIDHDDIALLTRFEEQVQMLDAHPKIGVVGSYIELFPHAKTVFFPQSNEQIEEYLMQGCAVAHTSAMIRACILPDNPYEAEFSPAEDYALWCRLIGKTKFYNIPKVLMKYRIHDNNTTKKQSDKMSVATKAIHEFVRKNHSRIWQKVCDQTPHVIRLKLFGLIPLGHFRQIGKERKGILKFLPFITIKAKQEVK